MDYKQAAELFATARDPHRGKPLGRNTRLHKRGDNYAIQLHYTDVVTFLPDGRIVLDSGGWRTVTTQVRIHEFARPVRVYGDPNSNERPCPWVIASHEIGRTEPKVQKCRKCHGEGTITDTRTGVWRYDAKAGRSIFDTFDTPEISVRGCGWCHGGGRHDYGSKPIHPAFYDGIVIDTSGRVVEEEASVSA